MIFRFARVHFTRCAAADNGHAGVVSLLVAAKASLSGARGSFSTPLIAAAKSGHADVVKLLRGAGASDFERDISDEYSALDMARQGGHEACVKLLEEPSVGMDEPVFGAVSRVFIAACAFTAATTLMVLLMDILGADHGAQPGKY